MDADAVKQFERFYLGMARAIQSWGLFMGPGMRWRRCRRGRWWWK